MDKLVHRRGYFTFIYDPLWPPPIQIRCMCGGQGDSRFSKYVQSVNVWSCIYCIQIYTYIYVYSRVIVFWSIKSKIRALWAAQASMPCGWVHSSNQKLRSICFLFGVHLDTKLFAVVEQSNSTATFVEGWKRQDNYTLLCCLLVKSPLLLSGNAVQCKCNKNLTTSRTQWGSRPDRPTDRPEKGSTRYSTKEIVML